MRSHIVIFLTFFFIQSCQSPPATPVHANLYVRYEQEDKKLKAEAVFYDVDENGNRQSMVLQQGLSFLGSGTETRSLPGGIVRYHYEQTGRLPEALPFRWKDESGTQQTVELSPVRIDEFDLAGGAGISKTGGATLQFGGGPLAGNEQLILLITDAANKPVNLTISGPTTSNEIQINASQLAPLTPGRARLQLVRKRTEKLEGPFGTADVTQEYYTQTRGVVVGG